jgi:nitroreductase
MNETLNSIRNRRSTRSFQSEQIENDELQAIIDAGIYAPSATNLQPWHFTVIQNKDILDRLSAGFKELAKNSNNEYLKKFGNSDNYHVFHNAPTVVIVSGDENIKSAPVDCAATVENMLVAAESLKIGSCWIGLIAFLLNSEEGIEYIKELEIPQGFKQIHAVALGYKKNKPTNAPARKENTVNYIK